MIIYLVSATDEAAPVYAESKGWVSGNAIKQYVTPDKDRVWAVRRFTDLPSQATPYHFVRGLDYDDGPPQEGFLDAWIREKARFDAMVTKGEAIWVDWDELYAIRRRNGISGIASI